MSSDCVLLFSRCALLLLFHLAVAPATAADDAAAFPTWVLGNHSSCSACSHHVPIDVESANAQAYARALECNRSQVVVIVPGDTPIHTKQPLQMVREEQLRLLAGVRACKQYNCCVIAVSGGNVHPDDTPFNEAWEMRAFLLQRGVPQHMIVGDFYARHTTTNLRNVGRFMLAYNLSRAVITTNYLQELYLDFPGPSGFTSRCLRELGYAVGSLTPHADPYRISFAPSAAVWKRAADARDP
jgi:hypothetical protein